MWHNEVVKGRFFVRFASPHEIVASKLGTLHHMIFACKTAILNSDSGAE